MEMYFSLENLSVMLIKALSDHITPRIPFPFIDREWCAWQWCLQSLIESMTWLSYFYGSLLLFLAI